MIHKLLILGNPVTITTEAGSGSIDFALPREVCPSCEFGKCFNDCDGSQGADENNKETEEYVLARRSYNASLDVIESLMLAHACAGIKVDDPKYVEGIEATFLASVELLATVSEANKLLREDALREDALHENALHENALRENAKGSDQQFVLKDRVRTLSLLSGLEVFQRRENGKNVFDFYAPEKIAVKSCFTYPKAKLFAEGVWFGRTSQQ